MWKDRKKFVQPTCQMCKYCLPIRVETDEGDEWEYYCMLGASNEDIQYVENEVYKIGGYIPDLYTEFTDKFLQIMEITSTETYLEESDRYVESDECCNYYTTKGKKNEQV